MVGSYQMTDDKGELFDVAIPAFSLDSPFVGAQRQLSERPPHEGTELLGNGAAGAARRFDTTSHKSNLSLIRFVEDYLLQHGVVSQIVPTADGEKASLYRHHRARSASAASRFRGIPTSCPWWASAGPRTRSSSPSATASSTAAAPPT